MSEVFEGAKNFLKKATSGVARGVAAGAIVGSAALSHDKVVAEGGGPDRPQPPLKEGQVDPSTEPKETFRVFLPGVSAEWGPQEKKKDVVYEKSGSEIHDPSSYHKLVVRKITTTNAFLDEFRKLMGEDEIIPDFNPETQEAFMAARAGDQPSLTLLGVNVIDEEGVMKRQIKVQYVDPNNPGYDSEGKSKYIFGIYNKEGIATSLEAYEVGSEVPISLSQEAALPDSSQP